MTELSPFRKNSNKTSCGHMILSAYPIPTAFYALALCLKPQFQTLIPNNVASNAEINKEFRTTLDHNSASNTKPARTCKKNFLVQFTCYTGLLK